jgi:hypothetical protein
MPEMPVNDDIELEALDLESTAAWRRRKAEEYPEDGRNETAAEALARLAAEVRRLEGTALHREYSAFLDAFGDDALSACVERANVYRSRIGFDHLPATGQEYLRALMRLGREILDEHDLLDDADDDGDGDAP